MIGSDSSTTDFPGKIPSGADVPSDTAANWAVPDWSVYFLVEGFIFRDTLQSSIDQ